MLLPDTFNRGEAAAFGDLILGHGCNTRLGSTANRPKLVRHNMAVVHVVAYSPVEHSIGYLLHPSNRSSQSYAGKYVHIVALPNKTSYDEIQRCAYYSRHY